MKHTQTGNSLMPNLAKRMRYLFAICSLLAAMQSCKKELITETGKTGQPGGLRQSIPFDLVLTKIAKDSGTVKKPSYSNNLKQIGLAVHQFGQPLQLTENIIYEYDADEVLRRTRHTMAGSSKVFTRNAAGQLTGFRFYPDGNESLPPAYTGRYRYNEAGFMIGVMLYNSLGEAGVGREYSYHANGQIASIKYTEQQARGVIGLGMVFTQGSASPRQVEAWKHIARLFPEPELPWEILTLLCDRFEVSGTIPDPEVPNGGNIKVKKIRFNEYDLVAEKETEYPRAGGESHPIETVSFYYNRL